MTRRNTSNINEIFVRRQNSWFWFKLTAVCLMIMVFGFSVSSFANKNDSSVSFYECDTEIVGTQMGYMAEGIKVLNSSKTVNEDLVDAVWKLTFSINTDETCPSIIGVDELDSLNKAFDFESITVNEKIDLINAKLQLLNKAQISEPTKLIGSRLEDKDNIDETCNVREQKLFDILGSEIEKNRLNGVTSEMILFLRQLNEELDLDISYEDNLDIVSFEELLQEKSKEAGCELDIDDSDDRFTQANSNKNQKEYLCSDGEIVVDKLLCSLN